eukprot:106345-Prymnesium_polylepis.1
MALIYIMLHLFFGMEFCIRRKASALLHPIHYMHCTRVLQCLLPYSGDTAVQIIAEFESQSSHVIPTAATVR